MAIQVVSGTANEPLAVAVADQLGIGLTDCEVVRFRDGELRPVVTEVRGEDVYVVQPTGPPVNEHLVELLLLVDACRRAGADRVTAVVPYFGYARQDRRSRAGEAIGVRVVTDALTAVGAHRLVVVDPHTVALEAIGSIPVEMLTAVPILAAAIERGLDESAVVVAPDMGAVKLAERYARLLDRPVAVVRKTRVSGEAVTAHDLVGDVTGRAVVVVDDMISTGGTIGATLELVLAHRGGPTITVAATHGVLVEGAIERISSPGLARLLVTDTLVTPAATPLEVCSVAPLLVETVGRLHRSEPLDDLLLHA